MLIKRLKNYHKDICLNGRPELDYDFVCVIDYEATCTENKINYPHEIIEFPIVLINMKTLQIVRAKDICLVSIKYHLVLKDRSFSIIL